MPNIIAIKVKTLRDLTPIDFFIAYPWIEFDFASDLTEKIMAAILYPLAKTVHGEGLKFL